MNANESLFAFVRVHPRINYVTGSLQLIIGDDETWAKYEALIQAFAEDPAGVAKLLLDEMARPIVEDWEAGRYGEATGRLLYEVLSTIGGPKALDKLAKAGKLDDLGDLGKVTKPVACLLSTPSGKAPGLARPAYACGNYKRFIDGVEIRDLNGNVIGRGTVDLKPTLDRIRNGQPHPHIRDNTVFRNREGRLPSKPAGYYTEYVHPTPGHNRVGPQRIVVGKNGEVHYTPDHYRTFYRVDIP